MKVLQWAREWWWAFAACVALAVVPFLAFEFYGLVICETMGLSWCSTLSLWLALTPGPRLVGGIVGAVAVVLTWHFFDCLWRQQGKRVCWVAVVGACALEYAGFVAFVLALARWGTY